MNEVVFISGQWGHWGGKAITRPIACYQLAWWLRTHQISCQVIEFAQLMSFEQLKHLLEISIDNNTTTICISTVFWPDNPWSIPIIIDKIIEYIRNNHSQITIIGGGIHVEKFNSIKKIFDICISGEGENFLLKYCLSKKSKLPKKFFNIVSLEHRFIEQDIILEHETLPIELGRGCIFKCKFCSTPNIGKKKGTYQRHYQYTYDEISYNYDKFGTNNYMFLDDTVNEDQEKINFLATIPKKLNKSISWCGYLRADLIWAHKNHEQLLESGIRNAYFGLETLHPQSSKLIGKAWNGKFGKDWIPHLYNNLWSKRVKLEASFIVGLPLESENSLLKTAQWIKDINAGSMFFMLLDFYSNSDLTKNYKNYNYEVDYKGQWTINTITGITREYAKTLTQKLNYEVLNSSTVGGWQSANLFNTGMSLDNIATCRTVDLPIIMYQKSQNFINSYIKKFTNYYKKL